MKKLLDKLACLILGHRPSYHGSMDVGGKVVLDRTICTDCHTVLEEHNTLLD